jgi:hypothetical protein
MVCESSCCWSDSVGSTFYVATILLGRARIRPRIWRHRDQWHNGLAGTVEVRFDQQTNLKCLTGYHGVVDSGVAWNPAIALLTSVADVSRRRRSVLHDGWTSSGSGGAVPLSYGAYDNEARDARI